MEGRTAQPASPPARPLRNTYSQLCRSIFFGFEASSDKLAGKSFAVGLGLPSCAAIDVIVGGCCCVVSAALLPGMLAGIHDYIDLVVVI